MTSWQGYILYEHQVLPSRHMACCREGNKSLILNYDVGSGKTLTALYTVHALATNLWKDDEFPNVMIIAPAKVLLEVWSRAIHTLKMPIENFNLLSYEIVRKNYPKYVKMIRDLRKETGRHTVTIVDEAHVIRNVASQSFHAVFSIAAASDKNLLLTGTPMVNGIKDLTSYLRILNDDSKLNIEVHRYLDNATLETHRLKELASFFSGLMLSYRLSSKMENYPNVDRSLQQVPMYSLQKVRYKEFEKQFLTPALKELMERGIISNALNSFLTRTRAISNVVGKFALEDENDRPENSEKFKGIRHNLINGPKPAIVYSFYLDNGVIPMKEYIDDTTDLRTEIISGKTTQKQLRDIIRRYNDEKSIDVLFFTSAVRQGITLLRTRMVEIMEPGWNESLTEQVIGRVARYGSHSDLPLSERNVKVNIWITTIGKGISTDQYILELSNKKEAIIEKVEKVLEHVKLPKKCC